MTGPAYGIRLTIDPTDAERGGQRYVRTIESVKAVTPQATNTVNQLRDALRQMGLAEDLVQKSIQRTMGVQQQAATSTVALAKATTVAGTATAGAAVGSARLTTALQTLAFSATGLPGPLGRVSGMLGSLAVGSAPTIAILAGLAAVAFAIERAGRASRKAADDLKELIERGKQLFESNRNQRTVIEEQLANIRAAIKETEKELQNRIEGTFARVLRGVGIGLSGLFPGAARFAGGIVGERAGGTATELADQKKAEAGLLSERKKLNAEAAKEVAEKWMKSAKERAAAEADLTRIWNEFHEERAARAQEELDLFDKQLAAILAADPIYQAQLRREEERLKLFKEFQRIQGDIALDPARFGGDLLISTLGASGTVGAPAIAKADEAYKRLSRTIGQDLQQAITATFSSGSDAVQGFVRDLNQGVSSIIEMIARGKELGLTFKLGEGFSGKGSTGANLSAGLGIGSLAGNLTGSGVGGLIGGAAGGAAVGGPLGAIAGAVSGFVSGLLSSAAKARQLAEARKAFESNLDDLIATVHPRGALGDALNALGDTFDQLARQAAAARGISLGGGSLAGFTTEELQKRIAELNAVIAEAPPRYAAMLASQRALYEDLLRVRKATDEAAEAEKRLHVERVKQASEDLDVRGLRAQGLDAEADAAAFANAQERERAALLGPTGDLRAGIDAALYANLLYVQSLEAVAFAAAQAAAAEEKRFQDSQTAAEIEVRTLENLGEIKKAEAARRAIDVAKEIHEAKKLVDQGIITQGMFDAFVASFGAMTASIEAATAAAQAATAFQNSQTSLGIDAEIARNKGDVITADRINEEIRQNNERNRVKGLYDQGVITKIQFDDWMSSFAQSLLPKFDDVFGNTLGGGRGATQALTAVSATVTDRTALVLVDYAKQQVSFQSYLPRIYDKIAAGGGGGGGVTIAPHIHFGSVADFTHAELMNLVDEIEDELDVRFGNRSTRARRGSGSVS